MEIWDEYHCDIRTTPEPPFGWRAAALLCGGFVALMALCVVTRAYEQPAFWIEFALVTLGLR